MKTAWIFPGGSARAVYTAGSIYALCDLGISRPDIIIGGSGSTGNCLCYVANQKEIIKEVWCNRLSTYNFLSFWRFWKILNIDYLIDIVLKKDNPLNIKEIVNSSIIVYLPVTDSKTGEIEYISNKMDVDLYEVLRASISVPIWTNLFSVMGNFVNGKYYSDSPPSARFQLHIQKAIEEGAKRIIVFDSWHHDDNPTGFLYAKIYTYMRNREYKERQLSYIKQIENFVPPKNVEFVHLYPLKKLNMSRIETDNDNARKIFNQGYDETFHNEELKRVYI
jgi:predicted patatin/cPLA2 family phospholipase